MSDAKKEPATGKKSSKLVVKELSAKTEDVKGGSGTSGAATGTSDPRRRRP
jgi:hypothetical protein